MSFDRGRRGGRGRDKRDRFGEDDFDAFSPPPAYGDRDRFGGGGGGGGYGAPAGGGGFGAPRGPGGGGGAPRSGGFGGMPTQVVGEAKGKVKFFNAQKGFGFIQREDGGEDVFVHISAVERAGLSNLAEGQGLEFTLVDRGGKVSASDLKVDGELIPVSEGGGGGDRGERAPRGEAPRRELTGERATGTVKFFNSMKGFGFITRDDGQPDAFVHISAVERAGMAGLNQGDRLEFDLEVDRRGKHSAVNLVAHHD
ncbi:cold-shock protein [Sphingomonas sp. 35-24ZXX]|jgi:CspA family cold shock protein|uniref:cold-shock protein n=1 Tax=Sphingomonas sp. 35-24ZXX TaxID=1545915 RepID=UPI00053BFF96|nr:cold-shock protein [Sphingomonas sp. 35-24ZXX]